MEKDNSSDIYYVTFSDQQLSVEGSLSTKEYGVISSINDNINVTY